MCTWEYVVFCYWVENSVCVRSIWSMVLFKSAVSLLIFCLDFPSIIVSVKLMSPTVIVLLPVSAFGSVNLCLIDLAALILGAYVFKCYIFLLNLLFSCCILIFVSREYFRLKVYFVWGKCSHPCSLLVTICIKYFFPIPSL